MILLNYLRKISLSPTSFANPKRPPLAEWRILDYGKDSHWDKHMATFSYKEREEPEVKWTVPVEKFISLLIQHIPPRHFGQVRWCGALASRTEPLFKRVLSRLFPRMKEITKSGCWRERITNLTGKDPFAHPSAREK